MDSLRGFMRVYQYLFHPGVVLVAASLLLVYREWSADHAPVRSLVGRAGTVLGVEVVATVPVVLYLLVRRQSVTQLTAGTDWRINLVTAASLVVGGALLWYLRARKPWGRTVGGLGKTLVFVAVPYALIAPVWNVSGHVTFTLVPTLYLALVDRAFWPFLAVPAVMVANRPLLEAHTWFQSIGGFVLGIVGVLAAWRG